MADRQMGPINFRYCVIVVVMTSSFNEWWESTNVEPSVNYGFQFLNLTDFFVAEWKYGAQSSPVSITGAQTEELLLVTYVVRASLLLSMSYFFFHKSYM